MYEGVIRAIRDIRYVLKTQACILLEKDADLRNMRLRERQQCEYKEKALQILWSIKSMFLGRHFLSPKHLKLIEVWKISMDVGYLSDSRL